MSVTLWRIKPVQTRTIRRGALRFATQISPLLNYHIVKEYIFMVFYMDDHIKVVTEMYLLLKARSKIFQ